MKSGFLFLLGLEAEASRWGLEAGASRLNQPRSSLSSLNISWYNLYYFLLDHSHFMKLSFGTLTLGIRKYSHLVKSLTFLECIFRENLENGK